MIRGRKSPTVHVIAYKKNADSPTQLTVTPDPLDMTQFPKGKHIITWRLDTTGFHFPLEGPAIEFTTPGWEKSFVDIKVSECGRTVTALNLNVDGQGYAYNIHVIHKASGERLFLDPVVGNNSP
jgi:hypothetical protein